jgi:hypothetical protein
MQIKGTTAYQTNALSTVQLQLSWKRPMAMSQRVRRASRDSQERDFYVWSNSPEKYQEAWIIFKDFQTLKLVLRPCLHTILLASFLLPSARFQENWIFFRMFVSDRNRIAISPTYNCHIFEIETC